ncbi:MAG: hypothetical protein JXB62_09970 [Pirellulales bacterium]|nr:hypothetical protein [Pirellulales bacterium]
MIHFAPLWAQGWDDLIGIAVVILFIVVPAILQLLGKGVKGQQKPAPRRPPAPRGQGQPVAGDVEDEIGEFLRRAAQRRGGQQPPPPPPQPARRPATAQVVVAQPVEAEVARPRALGNEVQEHVGQFLDAGKFKQRSSQLGTEVAHSDERIEDRLHKTFDHEVSQLTAVPGEAAASPRAEAPSEPEDRIEHLPVPAAAGLPALLSSPTNLRQAIVISEILQRPEHRWT